MMELYICTECGLLTDEVTRCDCECDLEEEITEIEKVRTYFVAEYRASLGSVEGCTPGPWGEYESFLKLSAHSIAFARQCHTPVKDLMNPDYLDSGSEPEANLALIASAPDMAAEIRQLREENEELKIKTTANCINIGTSMGFERGMDNARAEEEITEIEKVRTYFVAEYRASLGSVEGCTPGPWEWGEHCLSRKSNPDQIVIEPEHWGGISGSEENRAIIEQAPEMAAEIAKLREEIAALEKSNAELLAALKSLPRRGCATEGEIKKADQAIAHAEAMK